MSKSKNDKKHFNKIVGFSNIISAIIAIIALLISFTDNPVKDSIIQSFNHLAILQLSMIHLKRSIIALLFLVEESSNAIYHSDFNTNF